MEMHAAASPCKAEKHLAHILSDSSFSRQCTLSLATRNCTAGEVGMYRLSRACLKGLDRRPIEDFV
jgi:hypothetical protein